MKPEIKCCPRCGFNLTAVEPVGVVGELSISLYGDCYWRNERIPLTQAELTIVHAMACEPGVYFTAEALNNILGSEDATPNNVHVLISRIRRKFCAADPGFDRVARTSTSRNRGFCWRADGPPVRAGLASDAVFDDKTALT